MKRMNILIVDDEPQVCEMLKKIIINMGHRAYITNSGEEALDMMDFRKFDIALLDIKMPDLCGDKIIRELKEKRNDIKIIVYSGIIDEMLINNIKNLGVDSYITKPAKIHQIEQSIERAADS